MNSVDRIPLRHSYNYIYLQTAKSAMSNPYIYFYITRLLAIYICFHSKGQYEVTTKYGYKSDRSDSTQQGILGCKCSCFYKIGQRPKFLQFYTLNIQVEFESSFFCREVNIQFRTLLLIHMGANNATVSQAVKLSVNIL